MIFTSLYKREYRSYNKITTNTHIESELLLGALTTMPNVLWKMEQLRHLYIPKGKSLGNKFKLHTLNNLHTLWGVTVN